MTHCFELEIKYQLIVISKIYGSDLQFVNEKGFWYICNEKCISYVMKNYLSFSFGNLNKDTDELYLILLQPTLAHIFPP